MVLTRVWVVAVLVVGLLVPAGVGVAAASDEGCDFNGDGYPDLAIGVPDHDVGGISRRGSVHVIYGTSAGLAADGDQVWHRGQDGMGGFSASSPRFGWSVGCGDFDGDGYEDLVAGVPEDDVPDVRGRRDAGSVHVIYGSSGGLSADGNQIWDRSREAINGNAREGDRFGTSVATGDFDGDGYEDLAVGVPDDDVTGTAEAGSVHVIYGSSVGLSAEGNQIWHRDRGGISGSTSNDAHFGSSVAAGDFDGDGYDDLVAGVPGDRVGGTVGAGSAHVIYGTVDGLTRFGDQIWHRDRGGINQIPGDHDYFGSSVAAGDFDGDGHDDLVAGVPGDRVGGIGRAGSAHVIYGTVDGLARFGDQVWHRDRGYINGTPRPGDGFGGSVAAGDFDGDGYDDLVAGVPGDRVGGTVEAGSVNVIYGTLDGLSAVDDQVWNQEMPDIEDTAEQYDWFGSSAGTGDYDGDGYHDLTIGIPGEDIGAIVGAGMVNVIYGDSVGLVANGNQVWSRDTAGISGSPGGSDRLGFSVN